MSLLQMSFSGAVLVLVIAAIRAVTINRLPKKNVSDFMGDCPAAAACPVHFAVCV